MKPSQAGVRLFSDDDKDRIARCYMADDWEEMLWLSRSKPALFNDFKKSLKRNGFFYDLAPSCNKILQEKGKFAPK